MSYTFGPVASRRFGLSLGIDLSPESKTCNFDCLYCELEPAKPVKQQINAPKVEDIVQEVQEALARHPQIDVITITSNGEPTLYPHLEELVDRLNQIKGNKKLLILSNASTVDQETIQKALAKIDIVKLSLDCATPRCFKRLDRPHTSVSLERIIEGMKAFRKLYKGLLVVEILVVKGINDKEDEFEALGEVLRQIKPDRIDVGTIDRPPAYKVEPVSYERLFELAHHLKGLPVAIVARKSNQIGSISLDHKEIITLLRHRPITRGDLELFDEESKKRFFKLLDSGKITVQKVGAVEFFSTP